MINNFKFAVLISGNGSNLQALIDACIKGQIQGKLNCVISNNPDAYGLIRAKKAGIFHTVVNNKEFETRENFDLAMEEDYKINPDLIVLAGFMRILSPFEASLLAKSSISTPLSCQSIQGLKLTKKFCKMAIRNMELPFTLLMKAWMEGPFVHNPVWKLKLLILKS